MEKIDLKIINAEQVIRFLVMLFVATAFGRYIFQKYYIDFNLLPELTSEIDYISEVTLFYFKSRKFL